MTRLGLATIPACLLLAALAHGQWLPDQRLTEQAAPSKTPFNNAWCVATAGDTVHAVWYDSRIAGNNYEIFYKRSTDGGASWGDDTRLTDASRDSNAPSVAVDGAYVHVAWWDYRDGDYEIYYKRSTDGGTTWGSDTRLTDTTGYSWYPSIAIAGSNVHVVWGDTRDGNYEIYYKRSLSNGSKWEADTRLTDNTSWSDCPSVAVAGDTVHVVWFDNREGHGYEIYYKRSTDNGANWGDDTRLTDATGLSWQPSIAVGGTNVHVVWFSDRDLSWPAAEIYYKRSTDGGVTWGNDIRLTNDPANSRWSSVAVAGTFVHLVWQDNRDGNYEIYYKCSTDGGVTWPGSPSGDTRLTNAARAAQFPSVAVAGAALHVVWYDYRDGNYEIYYKRNPTGNVAVGEPGLRGPCGVLRIAPNPLASGFATLRFSLVKAGPVALTVFDVAGRSVLRQSAICSLQSAIALDLRKVPAGVYLVRLDADGCTATQTLVVQRKSGRN